MALRGNLNDFSLPDVFQLVTFSRKTGVLRIEREDGAEGSVWFRDGEVFFAQSNWRTAMLGERLVRAQRITPQALDKALQIRAAEGPDGRRLGAILTQEGYIADAVLETFVQEQIQETIFDLMRWDEGDFDFEAMPEVAEEDIGLSISIENVIMEGSRRLDEWGRIKKKIPSMDIVFKMATAPGEGTFEISLKPAEWNLLLLVDGTRSVADMAHETSRTDFDVARIVYGLFSAGLLEFTGDDEVQRLRAEKRERDALVARARAVRRAAEDAARAEAVERETALETRAKARAEASAEDEDRAAAETAAGVLEPPVAVAGEEPLFFGKQLPGPTAEDAAVLEEMMGAVLQHPVPEQPESAPVVEVVESPEVEFVAPEAPEPERVVEPASISAPLVPGLDMPLIPVLSAEEMLSDLSPIETPTQTIEQALAAVAEAATMGLDWEKEPPAVGIETVSEILEAQDEATPREPRPAPIEPVIEREIVWEPEPEPTSEPEPEPEPEPELGPGPEPIAQPEPEPSSPEAGENMSSYERELMSLGLGELPSDLFGGTPIAKVRESPPAAPLQAEPLVFDLDAEPLSAEGPLGEDANVNANEALDLGALLESLDREGEEDLADTGSPATAALDSATPAGFDVDILREVAPSEPTSGVISTDSFMEEMTLDSIGLSGGMTDELSALTGASRPARPVVNVAGLLEHPSGLLKRDQNVDKDTLLRIIDGIKSL